MRVRRSIRRRNHVRPFHLLTTAALLALAFAAGSVFNAYGTPAPAVYSACVSPSTLRLPSSLSGTLSNHSLYNVTINGAPSCQLGDPTITWNQQGPMGETGPSGPLGPTGVSGPSGPTGPAGAPHNCDITTTYPGMNLAGCDLTDADLSNADLRGANLAMAELFEADLTNADLSAANLAGTSLEQANLTDANLFNADLAATNLYKANFTDTRIEHTRWDHDVCPDGTFSDDHGGTCEGHLSF